MSKIGNSQSYCRFPMWVMALLFSALAAGCGGGGGGQDPILGGGGTGGPVGSAKAITAYSIAGVRGTIDEAAKTIAVTVPNGTNVTAQVAAFTSTGAGVKVGAAAQASGTTPNNFTAPVAYSVTATDGSTATYAVTVSVSSVTAKAISAYAIAGVAGTIDEAAKTIAVTLPSGTNVTAQAATFTTTGTGVKVGAAAQVSGTTPNNFTAPVAYTVSAADGTTASYAVSVTVGSASAKAISAYSFAGYPGAAGTINEAAKTIAVTVPNGTDLMALAATFSTTGTGVKVGAAAQASGTTPNNFTTPVTYTVSAADGTTATYAVSVTPVAASAKAISTYSIAGFPAVAGTINEAAKTIAVTMPTGTNVTALVAAFTTTGANVKVGTAVQTSTATANNFTAPVAYIVTAADGTTATYAVTVTVAPNSAKAITAFSFAGYTGAAGTINEAAKTIAVTVPFGTDVTTLAATFATTGASVKVGTAVQTSTATANNFTAPVAYIVTAADGTTATYTVTVAVAPNSAKAITAYSFAGYTGAAGTINEAPKTIAVTVPFGTDVTALAATFATTGASVKVGTAVQTSTATANNFTSPVAYIVTAADGTTATYTVTVTVAPNSAKAITAYSFAGFTDSVGVINELVTPKTIAVSVPPGTNLTALVATFTTTGTGVKVGTNVQTSAATANDFTTSPVAYIVTAADGTTATYNVTVTLGIGPAPVLLGTAGNFTILTKSGITDVPSSAITGNIGASPITGAAIGVTCAEMATGNIYEVDAAYVGNGVVTCAKPGTTGGTPNADKTFVDTAVGDMATAYTDAAGRPAGVGPNLNIGAGTVATQTLVAGTYTWGSNVTITGDLTLNGGPNDVWIFQVTGTLDLSPNVKIILAGGALPKNIFWQATGSVTLGTTSHFEGVILAQTNIALNTGASINGRLLAQTAATLQSNAVTPPAP